MQQKRKTVTILRENEEETKRVLAIKKTLKLNTKASTYRRAVELVCNQITNLDHNDN